MRYMKSLGVTLQDMKESAKKLRIAVLKETKQHEYQVGMTPLNHFCVATYVEHGHQVLVETGAGLGTGFSDQDYQAAGASIAKDARHCCRRNRHDRQGERTLCC